MKNPIDQIKEIESEKRLELIAKFAKEGKAKKTSNYATAMHELGSEDDSQVNISQSLDHFAERELGYEQDDLAQENLSEMFG